MKGIDKWYKVNSRRNYDFKTLAPHNNPFWAKLFGMRGMKIFETLDELNVLVLILSAKVMDADGVHRAKEKKYILNFYQKHYKEIPTEDIEYILNQYLYLATKNDEASGLFNSYNPFELSLICATVYTFCKTKEMRATIVYYLFEIACTDRIISSSESKLLREISYRLGFRKKITDSFFAYFKGDKDIFDYTGNLHRKKTYKKKKLSHYINSAGKLTIAYQILGINKNATVSQIKAAYRKLARENHPDRFAHTNSFHIQKASERFIKINKAYEYIKSLKRFS